MATVIRADISKKNLWYIPKHRYYELKHFCMQYPDWKRELNDLKDISIKSCSDTVVQTGNTYGRPTETYAERMTYFASRIDMVDKAAKLTDDVIGEFVVKGVVRGLSYDAMYALRPIPCCREIYYELYRKFFYILSELRQ